VQTELKCFSGFSSPSAFATGCRVVVVSLLSVFLVVLERGALSCIHVVDRLSISGCNGFVTGCHVFQCRMRVLSPEPAADGGVDVDDSPAVDRICTDGPVASSCWESFASESDLRSGVSIISGSVEAVSVSDLRFPCVTATGDSGWDPPRRDLTCCLLVSCRPLIRTPLSLLRGPL
jgi:hypothetical protein